MAGPVFDLGVTDRHFKEDSMLNAAYCIFLVQMIVLNANCSYGRRCSILSFSYLAGEYGELGSIPLAYIQWKWI